MTRILFVTLILSLAACFPGAPEATVNEAAEAPAGEAAESGVASSEVAASEGAAVEPLPADDASPVPDQLPAVVAYVNGEAISGDDLAMAVGELEARAGEPVPATQRDSVIRGVPDQLISYRLLLQESLLRKVAVAEAAIDARMAELRAQFPSEEAFTQTLALRQMTLEDPGSGANGGDLGYFERGQMVGPFEEVAFSLARDQTSDLVESPFGYHIIRVLDKQAARTIPLTDVRPQIQQFLEGQHRESQTQVFIETLKAKSKVDIYI